MPFFTAAQVREQGTRNSCWVIYNEKVYDITEFVRDHPGGQDILAPFAGRDVTSVLNDSSLHIHSDAAYELLDEYYIGDIAEDVSSPLTTPTLSVTSSGGSGRSSDVDEEEELDDYRAQVAGPTGAGTKFQQPTTIAAPIKTLPCRDEQFLDLRKPLFPQLWNATYSKEYYLEQVHRPRFVPYYVPYFSNPWLDILSRTTWYTVPLVWLPFVAYQLWKSISAAGTLYIRTLEGFATGVLFWTLLEYSLHRFLFHLDDLLPDHPLALLVHFTLHGIHHHMPMDR